MESVHLICQNSSNWIKIQCTFRLGIKSIKFQTIVDNSIHCVFFAFPPFLGLQPRSHGIVTGQTPFGIRLMS